MENTVDSKQENSRHRSKSRVMDKLFGREKRTTEEEEENISAFLHGPSDKLHVTGASLPVLSKIDTSNARRWPTTAEVSRLREPSRRRSTSPKRSKKGHVRFTDKEPEIIGEGGDEAEWPTMEISDRKRSNSHPPMTRQQTDGSTFPAMSVRDRPPPSPGAAAQTVRAKMRADEGRALILRLDSSSLDEPVSIGNGSQNISLAPSSTRAGLPSPAFNLSRPIATNTRPMNVEVGESYTPPSTAKSLPTYSLHGATVNAIDNAFQEFSDRVKHFFRLFELSASSAFPITTASLEDLIAAASWWFLRGRMNIENTVKDRPSNTQGGGNYNTLRQQGHTDLAKALWIVSDVIPQRPEMGAHRVDELNALIRTVRGAGREYLADALDRCQSIYANIRKVAVSMKRHDCLPLPVEEALLPQTIDNTIWVAYPSFTPNIRALLSGQGTEPLPKIVVSPKKISDFMPLGDTREAFVYSRMWVDVLLIEGTESQQFRCSSILSIMRPHKEKRLTLMIANQTCQLALCIQSDKAIGPTWNDVTWQARINAIDIKLLSKGAVARVQCLPNDFKMLWSMYDYMGKVHVGFQPNKNEDVVLEMNLRTFQYFNEESQGRGFPKEPIPNCHVRVFEKQAESEQGARRKHRGLRIAIITHSSARNLNGITHDLPTLKPIPYSFMRGEDGSPALLLSAYEKTGAKKWTMVLNFDDSHKRSDLQNCITGGALQNETASKYITVRHFSITTVPSLIPLKSDSALDIFEWQGLRIVNASCAGNPEPESQQVVLSDHLRVIMDSKSGSVTDRINVEPGELRLRLSAQPSINEISLLRQPQEDITISVSESKMPKEVFQELTKLLGAVTKSQTIRKYEFFNIDDLHVFQTAITGFNVLFDSIAESFSILRRRMVVPIHKKWEASTARVQILRQNKVVQLVAFFENFSHGKCMNFVLKMTDTFESFNRNGKFCIRILDAKFPALDEADEDIKRDFVCLDMPDYPGEHDDITITFESETTRNKMAEVLPAQVKNTARLVPVIRK